jgi:hypothetical protein
MYEEIYCAFDADAEGSARRWTERAACSTSYRKARTEALAKRCSPLSVAAVAEATAGVAMHQFGNVSNLNGKNTQ